MSLILALPILEFNIGSYQFNAFTYPAWSSLILQIVSCSINVAVLRPIESKKPSMDESKPKEKPKNIFISKGVILCLCIFFYDGYLVSTITYVLPVVMMEGYEW